jgi:hypothetical protein
MVVVVGQSASQTRNGLRKVQKADRIEALKWNLGVHMPRRTVFLLAVVLAVSSSTVIAKGREWLTGEVAAEEIIRTPIGKKLVYRYSYTVHANGLSYTFDESKKLHLTVNAPVKFAINGDKIHLMDDKGKEHQETILQRAADKK